MKNILIIQTKKFGDIFQSGHLVQAIKTEYPESQVHMVCFKEFSSAASILNKLSSVITIDRKEIISTFTNRIYPPYMAIDKLFKDVEGLASLGIDTIINYSNDKLSTYLATYLADRLKASIKGIKFSSRQTLIFSNPASALFNEVLTEKKNPPMSYSNGCHFFSGLKRPFQYQSTEISSRQQHDESAHQNFVAIKQRFSSEENPILVGIQVSAGVKNKSIPVSTLVETIHYLKSHDDIIPVLLTAPTESDQILSREINQNFDNSLVSIEADFLALPSVLKEIQFLLTPDTSIKHLADLIGVPLLEVSLGQSPLFKQSTHNPKSLILSLPFGKRDFHSDQVENIPNLARDIYSSLLCLMQKIGDTQADLQSDMILYQALQDENGIFYLPKNESDISKNDFQRNLGRMFSSYFLDQRPNLSSWEIVSSGSNTNEFNQWINEERESLTTLTKLLLKNLRTLIETQENKDQSGPFLEALEELFSHCASSSISSFPALIFRGKIEALTSQTMAENFKEVETLLYQMKDHVQILMTCLQEIESAQRVPAQVIPLQARSSHV